MFLAVLLACLGVARGFITCEPGHCICLPIGTYCDEGAVQTFSDSDPDLNEIEEGAFQNADFVTWLDLSYNPPLTLHDESFVGLDSLKTLNLSANGFDSLPAGVFSPLGNLTTLVLSQNGNLGPLEASWFQGLSSLTSLNLQQTGLTTVSSDVIAQLPSLTHINLNFNPLSCENISTIYQLVISGVADSELKCNATFLIRDMNINVTAPTSTATVAQSTSTSTTVASSTVVASPTAVTSTTSIPLLSTTSILPSSPMPTASSAITSSTSRGLPMQTTVAATPTPAPPLYCYAETTLSDKGYFDWPTATVGRHVTIACPNGPVSATAGRSCMVTGGWGEVDASSCTEAALTTQVLADFSMMEVTMATSETVSELLASSLPSNQPLSLRDVDTFIDIAASLVAVGGTNEQVLNNTLLAINSVLESSGAELSTAENSSTVTSELRQLIDTILLGAVDANHIELILSFSHLVIGGFYIPPSEEPSLLTIVHEGEEDEVKIMVGGDVENTTVQVTVYDDTSLFDGSDECEDGEEGLDGVVVTAVVSVSDSDNAGGENVTITFNGIHVGAGDSVRCVRWNDELNCGSGGWELAGCTLIYSTDGVYQCQCSDQGSFSILDVPGEAEASSGSSHTVARGVFYGFIGLTFPLYLTVILAILLNRFLYILPTMQSVVAMAVSQCLSFIVMAISYERTEFRAVCYALASLHHYLFLVSICLLGLYPVLVCLKIFRRILYDRSWLIAPFMLAITVFPAVFIGVYAGLKYNDFTNDLDSCWMEADVFTYFTYASGVIAIVVTIVTLVCLALLACSDYTIEGALYLQLFSPVLNLLLFCGVLACYYLVGEGYSDEDYMLMATGALALLCSVYFFIANGVLKSRVRSALMCREDPVLKQKVAHYSGRRRGSEEGEEGSSPNLVGGRSRTAVHKKLRRNPMKLTDEMNLNYVDSYLGVANPVPLTMLGQVSEIEHGKRVRNKKKDTPNQQHRLTQQFSVV